MAEAAPKTDKSESMEEILQSIKKIMDDNTGGEAKPADPDVYELTNEVKAEPAAEPPPPAAAKAPPVEETVVPAPLPPEPESLPAPVATIVKDDADSLMSRQAKTAAANAFKKIESGKKDPSVPLIPSPQFRSGGTIEDLVLEVLRPMLKSWLDENLPIIAQKIVEKEVKRIVTFHYDQE